MGEFLCETGVKKSSLTLTQKLEASEKRLISPVKQT